MVRVNSLKTRITGHSLLHRIPYTQCGTSSAPVRFKKRRSTDKGCLSASVCPYWQSPSIERSLVILTSPGRYSPATTADVRIQSRPCRPHGSDGGDVLKGQADAPLLQVEPSAPKRSCAPGRTGPGDHRSVFTFCSPVRYFLTRATAGLDWNQSARKSNQ